MAEAQTSKKRGSSGKFVIGFVALALVIIIPIVIVLVQRQQGTAEVTTTTQKAVTTAKAVNEAKQQQISTMNTAAAQYLKAVLSSDPDDYTFEELEDYLYYATTKVQFPNIDVPFRLVMIYTDSGEEPTVHYLYLYGERDGDTASRLVVNDGWYNKLLKARGLPVQEDGMLTE